MHPRVHRGVFRHGAGRLTARQAAKAAGLARYEGAPCGRCGGTERDVCSRHCWACELVRQRKAYEDLTGFQYNRKLLLMRRAKALRRMAGRRGEEVGAL